MKIYKKDIKHNYLELEPEMLDDLWILNLIISNNDLVGAKTTRKVKINNSNKVDKKTIFVKILVEKKNLDLDNSVLRVSGKIKEGYPEEFVDLNSYHSIEIREGTKISIVKQRILNYELELLEKAKENSLLPKVYLMVLDDDESLIAKVNAKSFSIVAKIKSGRFGKRMQQTSFRNKYFSEILNVLNSLEFDVLVVAGPGFEKEYFEKYLKEKNFNKKVIFTHINNTGISGLNELLRGGSVKKILEDFKLQQDMLLVEKLFKEIAKDGLVTYGLDYINKALEENAIKELLVTDKFFMSHYDEIRNIFLKLDERNIKYHIINFDSEAGKQLQNIGGIAAFLYYLPQF